jgi:nitrile hydratase accessory protein
MTGAIRNPGLSPPLQELPDLPGLPVGSDGPVFREPWEARAFALAVHLSEAGYFTWPEWAAALAEEIAAARRQGAPDGGDTYYSHWLAALERLCTAKGMAGPEALSQLKDAWRRAYLATPHGKPVNLANGSDAD